MLLRGKKNNPEQIIDVGRRVRKETDMVVL
jgi:hypothetical protein